VFYLNLAESSVFHAFWFLIDIILSKQTVMIDNYSFN